MEIKTVPIPECLCRGSSDRAFSFQVAVQKSIISDKVLFKFLQGVILIAVWFGQACLFSFSAERLLLV